MKKIISLFFICSLLITACDAASATQIDTLSVDSTSEPAAVAEFTPIPTFTLEPPTEIPPTVDIPETTPFVTLSGNSNVIQFAANGTYVDIADSIAVGSSKTYSVTASKGQIMSISTLPQITDGNWAYISLDIKGADGSVLCPQLPNTACMFWRGTLPASQEYLITLTPDSDLDPLSFIMRVAINPPGEEVQYFEYSNTSTGMSLTYPDTFAPAIPVYGNYKAAPELTLQHIDPDTYLKTNLSEAYMFINSTSDAQIVANCTDPNQNGEIEQVIGEKTINGYTFVRSTSDGAGAGNYYSQEIYRMVNENICYEVIYFMHSTNIGNYPAGTVTEFDRNAVIQKFDEIFSTFEIN